MSTGPGSRRTRRRVITGAVAACLAVATAVSTGGSAVASPPINNGQKITGKPMAYTVQSPAYYWRTGANGVNCSDNTDPITHEVMKFEPTPYVDASGNTETSTIHYGTHNGAAYQMEVPANWNGDLVLWAHGYNGTGDLLCVQKPNIDRAWYLANGYAWAASSYSTNGYDVNAGVKDTHDLIPIFTRTVAKPKHVWLTGESMGGHIVGVSIEQYPNAYDGAMPVCGVLGDQKLFDYFYGASATAAALAGVPANDLPYPTTNKAYTQFVNDKEKMRIGGKTLAGSTAAYAAWAATVVNNSGGNRPGAFNALYGYWNQFGFGANPIDTLPFLIGLYPGTTAGTIGIAHGNVVDNTATSYSTAPFGTPAQDVALNAAVKRVSADPSGSNNGLNGIPIIQGNPDVPVLTLHGTGDLFVPFSMEQIYANEVAAHGKSDLLVQRAIRNVGHCGFTQSELTSAFTSLVSWAEGGSKDKPLGDDVTNSKAVADPTFGCQFTDPSATAGYTRSGTFFTTACPTP